MEITVYIIPSPYRTESEKRKIEEFGGKRDSFSCEDVGDWINKAKEFMAISNFNPISDDRLRIDVSGPDYPLLTMVDLLGLVHAGKGKESILAIVNSYMAEHRSFILAVVRGKRHRESKSSRSCEAL